MGGQSSAPGGKITYADLRDLRFSGNIPDTIQAWDYLVQGIEVSHSDLSNVQERLPENVWSGVAAQLAQDKLSTTKDGLQGSKTQIGNIATELKSFYSNLEKLSRSLAFVVEDPTSPHPPQPSPPNYKAIPMTPAGLVNCFKVDSDGTVDLTSRIRILAHETGLSDSVIAGWQNQFQANINWYVSEANALDEAASAELMKNMPKPAPTSNQKAPPTHMGGTQVTVRSWPDPTGTLWGIAQKVYGNGNLWPYIYEANKGNPNIPANWDPNDIQAGWEIHVPSISRNAPVPAVPAAAGSGDQSE